MTPTWLQKRPNVEPQLVSKSVPKRIWGAQMAPRPSRIDFWSIFCWFWLKFCRFLNDFDSILEAKIDPKSVPKRLRNVSNFIVTFEGHPEPPKISFWANMAPTWPPLGFKIDPKWNPNWCPNRSQNGSGEPKWPPDPPGSTFGRFFVDFDWNLVDSWSI